MWEFVIIKIIISYYYSNFDRIEKHIIVYIYTGCTIVNKSINKNSNFKKVLHGKRPTEKRYLCTCSYAQRRTYWGPGRQTKKLTQILI